MKGISSMMWEKMENGDEVRDRRSGNIAVKEGNFLLWKKVVDQKHVSELSMGVCMGENRGIVSTADALENEWELVKKEEKEIKTERWMRADNTGVIEDLRYSPFTDAAITYCPSSVMDNKNFLRWVGTMPGDGFEWPGNSWYVWREDDNPDAWNAAYDPESGFTKKIFAEYAEMRVEK